MITYSNIIYEFDLDPNAPLVWMDNIEKQQNAMFSTASDNNSLTPEKAALYGLLSGGGLIILHKLFQSSNNKNKQQEEYKEN